METNEVVRIIRNVKTEEEIRKEIYAREPVSKVKRLTESITGHMHAKRAMHPVLMELRDIYPKQVSYRTVDTIISPNGTSLCATAPDKCIFCSEHLKGDCEEKIPQIQNVHGFRELIAHSKAGGK